MQIQKQRQMQMPKLRKLKTTSPRDYYEAKIQLNSEQSFSSPFCIGCCFCLAHVLTSPHQPKAGVK